MDLREAGVDCLTLGKKKQIINSCQHEFWEIYQTKLSKDILLAQIF